MKNNRNCNLYPNDAEAETRAQNDRLTPEEEKDLSIRIQNGKQAQAKLQNGTALTAEEKAAEQRIVDDGKKAFETLVLRNMNLVYNFARQQASLNCGQFRSYDDFVQEGRLNLCNAANTYDWKKGVSFGTYASQCIKNGYIRYNAYYSAPLRKPEGQMKTIAQYNRMRLDHSVNETSTLMGISQQKAILLEQFLPGGSLQDPVGQDDETCELGEMIADPNAISPEDIENALDAQDRWLQVEAALAQLPAEQARVLRLLYGFETEEKLTLVQTAAILGGSVNGIHKKGKAAVDKLKKLLGNGLNDLPLAA